MSIFTAVRRRLQGTFYGWWLVTGAIGIQILQSGLMLQAFGIYVPIWREEFGWSKTALATVFSLQRLESGLLGPLQGWLLRHFGARTIMQVGLVVFGLGLLALSQVESLVTFTLAYLILAAGATLGGFLSLMTVIVNWFERKRSIALALMQVGGSIGGLLIPLLAWSLITHGWRTTAAISGLIVLLAGLPLSLLMRNRPEDYGQLPDGRQKPSGRATEAAEPLDSSQDFSTGQALRTPAFWLLSLGHALAVTLVSAVTVHLVIHLDEALTFSLQRSAFVVAFLTSITLVGQLLGGFLGDRMDKRIIASMAMLGHAGGILVLAWAGSLVTVLLFAALHGLAWGVRGPLMGALRADYFGRTSFATIMGFSGIIIMTGSMSGPILAGYLADHFGSYRPAFTLLAALAGLGAIIFLLVRRPKLRP